jgi:hypothetical protein
MLMFFAHVFSKRLVCCQGKRQAKHQVLSQFKLDLRRRLGMGGISWLERLTMWHLLPEYERYQGLSSFIIHNPL